MLFFVLVGCGTVIVVPEGDGVALGAVGLNREVVPATAQHFESGDAVLLGSQVCLQVREGLAYQSCVELSSEQARAYSDTASPELPCFVFDELGEAQIDMRALDCQAGEQGPDMSWEQDLSRWDVRELEGLELRWVWEEEEIVAAYWPQGPLSEQDEADMSWNGPPAFFQGYVPPAQTPLLVYPQGAFGVEVELYDAEEQIVAWAAPWQVQVEGASLAQDGLWHAESEGGRILLEGPDGSLVAKEWRALPESASLRTRLHVGVIDIAGQELTIDGSDAPFVLAWYEVVTSQDEVVRGAPVSWRLRGGAGAQLDGGQGPMTVVSLACAQGERERWERMTLTAGFDGRVDSQAFWVRLPALSPEEAEQVAARCEGGGVQQGCSSVGTKGGWLSLLLGAAVLLWRRERARPRGASIR